MGHMCPIEIFEIFKKSFSLTIFLYFLCYYGENYTFSFKVWKSRYLSSMSTVQMKYVFKISNIYISINHPSLTPVKKDGTPKNHLILFPFLIENRFECKTIKSKAIAMI